MDKFSHILKAKLLITVKIITNMKLTEELNIVSFFLGLTAFLQPMQQSTRKCVHLGSVDVLYAFCMTVSNEFVQ